MAEAGLIFVVRSLCGNDSILYDENDEERPSHVAAQHEAVNEMEISMFIL